MSRADRLQVYNSDGEYWLLVRKKQVLAPFSLKSPILTPFSKEIIRTPCAYCLILMVCCNHQALKTVDWPRFSIIYY